MPYIFSLYSKSSHKARDIQKHMQARAEAAEKDLAAVKERAWALMEEKDAQLQAAKVGTAIFSILGSLLRHCVTKAEF